MNNGDIQFEFKDICPIDDAEFHAAMEQMVKEPGLEHAIKYVLPDVDYPKFVEFLLTVHDKETFQHQVMWPFLEMLAKKTTSGVSISGLENIATDSNYTFITNHRDIVLDASFLNLGFLRAGRKATEIAIGSNLLIFDWISTLVRVNKCFIVKRGLGRMEALNAAKQLSAYIDHAINTKHESVWIAQREGRAKDASDNTQESLVKMLSLAGGGTPVQNLQRINICPVTIAYEYDPNDYLKAREFLLKRRDPDFKKSKRDDLFSMETGLLQFKGQVHFSLGKCLTPDLAKLPVDADRNTVLEYLVKMIDLTIHAGYKIYAINYIAADALSHTNEYEMLYTRAERERFMAYIEHQIDKVDAKDVTPEEREFMRHSILVMYANPLLNKLKAASQLQQQ